MGFCTTVVINNDFIHEIKNDPEFGKKVYDGEGALWTRRDRTKPVHLGNGASVIETHHAEGVHLIAVGGGIGEDLGYVGSWRATPVDMLRSWANQLGYDIRKKPNRSKD